MLHNILQSMFHLEVPLLEKIIRPIIVYLCLILFLRLFGKRELAQLNPFDLVVLLSLSNTVQNAIIGNDNSVSGGIVGAFSLLAINWLLMRFLFNMPRLNKAFEGSTTTLITDGVVDKKALKKETLTETELLSVLHKQGVDSFEDVKTAALEPNGTFYVEPRKPSAEDKDFAGLLAAVRSLTLEVGELHRELRERR